MFKDYVCFSAESKYFSLLEIEGIFVKVLSPEKKGELLKTIQFMQSKKELVVVEGGDNRFLVEQKTLDILLSPEKSIEKDFLHTRNSGLNQVLCRLAKQHNIAIGFSFGEVLRISQEQRAELLGRMMQNVRLCRKCKVNMVLGSFARNEFELRSRDSLYHFGICLGMKPEEAKKALER